MADTGNSTITEQEPTHTARQGELQALSAEIVDLFYTQMFSPESICTPQDVCEAFSEMLLRHWELCCIVIHLRGDDGSLREVAMQTDKDFDKAQAHRVGEALTAAVERENRELQIWLDVPEENVEDERTALRNTLEAAGMRAGYAVPIHAGGIIVGVLVAMTAYPERLRAALSGIRFVAAPIVIAVGNAQRASELREQHQRIEHLIEELRQHGDALEGANNELQRVNHYRSLFLARMSHELRTPLTSILGFAEIMLEQEKLTEAQHRFCTKIQDSGHQLQLSLNQLVDLSRLEAGQSELFLHEFSLRETLRESCAAVARLAQKQQVKIDCTSDADLASIVSDEGKLRQVLYNFMAHAISRSPLDTAATVRANSISPARFQISITDEGAASSELESLSQPVSMSAPSEKATNMDELGLVIARRLVEVLGGTLAFENLKPRGLKVTIELPKRPGGRV
jgi:signal transduction histidine kinase